MVDALILGVNGQDGSYLAEHLLAQGRNVAGFGRQQTSRWVADSRLIYERIDLGDAQALEQRLEILQPSTIFHLAAIHGASGYAYEEVWRDALGVNVGSVHACLEYGRRRPSGVRLFYASSAKAFGDPPPATIDESTPRRSTCLYGITKNATTDLIQHYRRNHGVRAAVGYFFNHDSPRRPDSYFLPRLALHLISLARGGRPAPDVATLDFWCDWGSAREFMELATTVMERDEPIDAIFATGRPVHATEVDDAMRVDLGLPPRPRAPRREAEPPVRAALNGLLNAAGRLPHDGAIEVARWILADRLARTDKA